MSPAVDGRHVPTPPGGQTTTCPIPGCDDEFPAVLRAEHIREAHD